MNLYTFKPENFKWLKSYDSTYSSMIFLDVTLHLNRMRHENV